MYRLRLLGGAALHGEHGPVRGRPVHRRRLALLSLLALAPQGRLGRERLIGMLWPESESEAARHLLSEALYVLRRELGDTAFLIIGDDVGLNLDVVSSDVRDFELATADRKFLAAVDLYRGPLLDGFYINEAEDFERWADEQRDRLARAYAQALEVLADEAEARGDLAVASERWRQLQTCDRYSSRIVLRLMRTLDGMGEHATAIRVAEAHAELIRAELGAEPDPSVLELAATLRADPRARPVERLPANAAPSLPAPRESPPVAELPAAVVETPVVPRVRGSRARRRAVGLLGAFALLVVVMEMLLRPNARAAAPPGSVNVVVLPVWNDRADAGAAERSRQAQHILTSSLAAVPRIWAMDGTREFGDSGAWQRLPIEQLLERSRRIGARYLIRLEVMAGQPAHIAVMAYHAHTGEQIARATAGEPDEPFVGGTQRVALEIARAIASRERLPLGESGYLLAATDSPSALSRFLLGRDLFRAGDFDEAAAEFGRAIRADSAFLLAYARLSMVETWNPRWDFAAARRAVDLGLRWRQSAPPIYGRLLSAQRHYVMRNGARAIEEFQRLTVDDPELLDGWVGLAESLFHFGPSLGGSLSDARAAFERVIALDSSLGPAYEHLAEIALRVNDPVAATGYAARVVTQKERDSYMLATTLRFGRGRERAEALRALDTAQRNTLSNIARLFVDRPSMIDTVGSVLLAGSRSPQDRRWGSAYRLVAATANGRCVPALAQWQATNTDHAFDKWFLASVLSGCGPSAIADSMLADARRRIRASSGVDLSVAVTETRDAFRALVLHAFVRGDSSEIDWLAGYLRRPNGSPPDSADPEPFGLDRTLQARAAILAGDTTRAMTLLGDGLRRSPWWVSSWAPLADAGPQRLFMVRALMMRGDTSGARKWRQSFLGGAAVGDVMYRSRFNAVRE